MPNGEHRGQYYSLPPDHDGHLPTTGGRFVTSLSRYTPGGIRTPNQGIMSALL